ncbi:hypothetical protein GCM10008955_30470 [Deinococcus malanensis]|uniref:Secreted protein n=1 Tax=Deinococcus malanensis TaxID=1706855 RepID=A0ABQ2EZ01_9DEIO|nr:hypothetical protein GCM10008955_30470 [Deinococcus malanensis]
MLSLRLMLPLAAPPLPSLFERAFSGVTSQHQSAQNTPPAPPELNTAVACTGLLHLGRTGTTCGLINYLSPGAAL